MKAIRIDPIARTVTAVEYPDGYRSIQRAIAHAEGGDTFCLAGMLKTDTVFVNDEGLYLFEEFFELPGCGQGLFAGPGLIVGTEIGDTDKTRPPKATVEEVTSKIKWHDQYSARRRAHELQI